MIFTPSAPSNCGGATPVASQPGGCSIVRRNISRDFGQPLADRFNVTKCPSLASLYEKLDQEVAGVQWSVMRVRAVVADLIFYARLKNEALDGPRMRGAIGNAYLKAIDWHLKQAEQHPDNRPNEKSPLPRTLSMKFYHKEAFRLRGEFSVTLERMFPDLMQLSGEA